MSLGQIRRCCRRRTSVGSYQIDPGNRESRAQRELDLEERAGACLALDADGAAHLLAARAA